MSLSIALSGIDAATTNLNTTSNNLANVSTTGFKSSVTEFSDLFAVSPYGVSNMEAGNGVQVAAIAQQFSQGNINATNDNLDLALSGQGFFITSNAGALQYTRNGAFQTDQNGYVETTAGARLQVYPPNTTGGFNTGTLSDLQLTTGASAPAATANAKMVMNLAANAAQPATAVFNPADSTSYNNSTSITVYDSLGAAHTGTLYFTKTAVANQWNTQLYVDGQPDGAAQTLTYTSSGTLTAPANGKITFPAYQPATGAAPLNMTFDFSTSTQYGSSFAVTSVTQDGYTTGQLTSISVSSTGVVQANYTNGQTKSLGQVAVADFANDQGLQQLGNTSWAQTFASGQALQGQAGNGGLGLIQSGALESSNVDLTAQLVNMITAQRDFQANSQAISADNQDTQTILNIR